jgi:hypothetical protein
MKKETPFNIEPEYTNSAFNWLTEKEILNVFKDFEDIEEIIDKKYGNYIKIIGYVSATKKAEVFYRVNKNGRLCIFHAKPLYLA